MASISQEVLMFWMVYPVSRLHGNGRLVYLRQQLATNAKLNWKQNYSMNNILLFKLQIQHIQC